MELREERALLLERIYRRRAHDGIAQAGIVAVARIVGHHEDDVGLGRGRSRGRRHRQGRQRGEQDGEGERTQEIHVWEGSG